ncbi:hypothetical protein HDU99_007515, partial [Rhizoclosmatium hyalinum]
TTRSFPPAGEASTSGSGPKPQGRVVNGFFRPVVGGVQPNGPYVGKTPVDPEYLKGTPYQYREGAEYNGWKAVGGRWVKQL